MRSPGRFWAPTTSIIALAPLLACGSSESSTNPGRDAGADVTADAHAPAETSSPHPDAQRIDAAREAASHDAPPAVDVTNADAPHASDSATKPDVAACTPKLQCTAENAATTCAGGLCVDSLCYPKTVDPNQWNQCGDGACEPCEDALTCPADCSTPPAITRPVYDDPNTMTVFVHGFTNSSASTRASQVYGNATPSGDLGALASQFGMAMLPEGTTSPTAPNQIVGVEYYGGVPAPWMSAADIAEIDKYPSTGGPTGLQRYARIVAKFLKHQMSVSGATHVNLVCHSMGCLLSRYVIENDLEQLASGGIIARWVGCAGVVAGAQLARLYAINPIIQQTADAIGLQVDDFSAMNPDYVQEYAASWDHKLWSADSPLYSGILMHHMSATDPKVPQADNIQLLDLFNPKNNPNDGIMFTLDEFFATTGPLAQFKTPSGTAMGTTHSYNYIDHIDAASNLGFHAIAAAGLWSKRKVTVTLSSLTLHNDREYETPNNTSEQGTSPGEVSVETQVAYDPYTVGAFGQTALVNDDEIAYRSPDLYQQSAGTTDTRGVLLFSGPVFDGQTSFQLTATINEVDQYPRWSVNEALLNTPNRPLGVYSGVVTLNDQTLSVSTSYADAVITVQVVDMY